MHVSSILVDKPAPANVKGSEIAATRDWEQIGAETSCRALPGNLLVDFHRF